MPSISSLFPIRIEDLLTKSDDDISIDSGATGRDLPDGSYERTISLVQGPAVRATPCPAAQRDWSGVSDGGLSHWPMVLGTFPDHVIVGCDGCDRYWKVPYELTSDDVRAQVKTGDPEPRVRAFLDPIAAVGAINDPPANPPANDSTLPAEYSPLPAPTASEA